MTQFTDQRASMPGVARSRLFLQFLIRLAPFAVLWWIFNPDDGESWVLGAPVVLLAGFLSIALVPLASRRLRPFGLIRFIFCFWGKSLLSSIDVASRVLQPKMPLHPGIISYPWRLRDQNMQVLMANATSLLPGTLSVGLDVDRLVVHALDIDSPILQDLQELEVRIADIFGYQLDGDQQ